MEDYEIAKNLLINKTCDNCSAKKTENEDKKYCLKYLGEAVGQQWWPRNKDGTCDEWK